MRKFKFITGERGAGKSSYILANYPSCTGFVTVKEDAAGSRLMLMNLSSRERRCLMYRSPAGPYIVHPDCFSWANRAILSVESGLVVLDECGWIECVGRGFYPALEHIRNSPGIEAVLSVRLDRLDWYLSFFAGAGIEVVRL